MDTDLMTRREIQDYFKITRKTVYNWTKDRGFPEPIRPSPTKCLWKRKEVQEWLEKQKKKKR